MAYTQDELIAAGKKALERQVKDKARAGAYASAIKRLISAHEPEFQKYLKEEKARAGV